MNKFRAPSTVSKLVLAVGILALAGLVFTAQPTPDLSGQWNSNIGAVYEIQQSGSQFTWSAPSLNQSGTGTVSGNNVSLSGPGWTVKGTITEKDASGKPTKIVGENGVVLFRTAGSPEVSFKPPAQQPEPPGPSGPGVTGGWTQFKSIPPLSPELLAKVAAPVTRRATIDSLSASPATKGSLDKVAASVGKTVNGLKEQTLAGNPAVDAPVSPSSKPAQAFLDLWKAPVHFSPTVPGPSYLAGGSTYVVGMTDAMGVYVSAYNTLQMMAQKDYFLFYTSNSYINVRIHLPPGGGQYMLAVHAVDIDGNPGDKATWYTIDPIVEATVISPVDENKVLLVKNSAGTGLVGMFADSPASQGIGAAASPTMANVSIILQLRMTRWGYYTGVTVTRL